MKKSTRIIAWCGCLTVKYIKKGHLKYCIFPPQLLGEQGKVSVLHCLEVILF